MKQCTRYLLLMAVFLQVIFAPVARAQDAHSAMRRIDTLIQTDLERSMGEIQSLSIHLDVEQKEELFSTHRIGLENAPIINLFVGFGLGSYLQGDYQAATAFFWTDMALFTTALFGISILLNRPRNLKPISPRNPPMLSTLLLPVGYMALIAVYFIMMVYRPLSALQPYGYRKQHNDLLRKALMLESAQTGSVSNVPGVPNQLIAYQWQF